MSAYPSAFDPTRFPGIPPAVRERRRQVANNLLAHAPVEVRGLLRVPEVPDAAITELWLESVNDRNVRSQSFQNLTPGTNAPVDPGSHFFFLPGVDSVQIAWQVSNPQSATRAKLELFSALKPGPIWTREYVDGAAATLLKGPGANGRGSLDASTITIDGDPDFPDRVPNVHGAPYQLRLTVTGSNGQVTTGWTYFDVLVHSIELHWGPLPLIPTGAIQDVLPIYALLTRRDEQALLGDLRARGLVIAPDAALELPLKSTNAAYRVVDEWFTWRDFNFLRYKGRWGAGPRLPILARIAMKSLAGPDGVRTAAAAKAIGPAQFLWDWKDKTEAVRRQDAATFDPAARDFVMAALKYKENAAGEPPDCLNAHADRGGKRGGPDRIFPTFNDPLVFPFAVAAPTTRTWGALSTALTSGPYAGYTGVIFQPSRMAHDSYRLRVFLASGHEATLDVGGTMEDLVLAHPGLPTAHTGMMEVVRQIDARYIRKGANTPRIDLDAVSQEYAKGGARVVWTEPVWGMAEFGNCLTAALTPDTTGESATYTRRGVAEPEAKARRRGLHNWTYVGLAGTIDSPVKTALAGFDQWYGTVAGAGGGQESAANFTLPGRDLVEAPYIRAVVREYINKNRASNDKKRKWRALKAQNPLVADPELLLTFFHNSLKVSERNKLWPEIQRRYEADGWQGWQQPRDRPELWANDNFNFKLSKLIYLSLELHLRKILADAFEGVTLFHYQHFFDTLKPDGTIYARQAAIGGVAAVALNTDLGLSGGFIVWDHPDNGQRQTLSRALCVQRGTLPQGPDGHTGDNHGECTFKDGNFTVVHEFGHFLHLPHATPTGGTNEAAVHDASDAKCVMNYDPDALHLCGGCLLRLRGWAHFQSKGMLGFDRTNPANPGPPPPRPGNNQVEQMLTAFYTDFL